MKLLYLRHAFVLVVLLLSAHLGWSQGATTAAMSGTITDSKGQPLPGATVVAVHTPTNTTYNNSTNADGRFNIQNMRVGGPYTVKVSFVGYQDFTRTGVNLTLAENFRLDAKLGEASTQLTEVTVTGRQNPVINADRTGAATTIQRAQIERLPSISRSFADFTRLTPQAGGGGFGGRSGAFNNITIDGAIFNNSFGLSSTLGGQTGAQPISIDAIDQIQVSIAPFDVRQGSFTGAGINAVTRSGTNKLQGSVYGFKRNQSYVGRNVLDQTTSYPNFDLVNLGVRLGGPLIKDKLFFFISYEQEKRNDPPAGNYVANRPGLPVPGPGTTTSAANASELDFLSNFLQTNYGYNPSAYENYVLRQNSWKATAKLDWNISQNNHFSIKYNYLKSYKDQVPSGSGAIGNSRSPGQNGLPFFSSYYTINNNINSFIAELNTALGSRASNNLTAGYSAFRDFRASNGGTVFPLVDIGNSTSITPIGGGVNASNTLTSFGYEPFTANNILNTDVYQLGDNYTMYLGKHNVTIGTYNELYKFTNGFAPQYNGAFQYNSLADFYASAVTATSPYGYNYTFNAGAPALTPRPAADVIDPVTGKVIAGSGFYRNAQRLQLQYSTNSDGSFPFAVTNAAQFGLYVQDEWTPISNLKVTYGLRADLPVVYSSLADNTQVSGSDSKTSGFKFRDGVQLNTSQKPNVVPLFSPRIGFNWDVNDDRKTQFRGGSGVFTGRVPFVWISNQASNNGVQFGSYGAQGLTGASALINPITRVPYQTAGQYNLGGGTPFNPDINAYRPQNGAAANQYNLAVVAKDFKFPQVWRTDLAIDQQLPGGIIATLEGIYSKDINAVYQQNVNLPNATKNATGVDNRPIFYNFGSPVAPGSTTPVTQATPGVSQIYVGANNLPFNNRIINGPNGNGTSPTVASPIITDAILMSNTNKGYTYSVTGQLQKSFSNGLYASLAYTFTDARSVNDGGSIAQSQWAGRAVSGDPNANVTSYSDFLVQHRVIGALSYRAEYLGHLGTTFSMFYEGSPASRYSYVYSGDMNGDGVTFNDLIYIPRALNSSGAAANEILLRDIAIPANQGGGLYTAAQQRADLDAFISQDPYLSQHRGQYAERNGAVLPWFNSLSLRLLQDVFTNIGDTRNTLQFSLDIFNLGNLLNRNWGTVQAINRTNPIRFTNTYSSSGQPIFDFPYLQNASRDASGNLIPATTLNSTFGPAIGNIGSRWQMQLGLRYIFN